MPPRMAACAGQHLRWTALGWDKRRKDHDPGLLRVCSARHLAILWQNRHDRVMKHRFASLTLAGLLTALLISTHARGQAAPSGELKVQSSKFKVEQPSSTFNVEPGTLN